MQSFVEYVRTEMLARFQQAAPSAGAIVPLRKAGIVTRAAKKP
jgi:MerR family transcriptional regulator/heat shock protein HspR